MNYAFKMMAVGLLVLQGCQTVTLPSKSGSFFVTNNDKYVCNILKTSLVYETILEHKKIVERRSLDCGSQSFVSGYARYLHQLADNAIISGPTTLQQLSNKSVCYTAQGRNGWKTNTQHFFEAKRRNLSIEYCTKTWIKDMSSTTVCDFSKQGKKIYSAEAKRRGLVCGVKDGGSTVVAYLDSNNVSKNFLNCILIKIYARGIILATLSKKKQKDVV